MSDESAIAHVLVSDERYAIARVLSYFDAAVTNGLQLVLPDAVGSLLHAASVLGGTPGWVLLIGFSFWWSGSRLGVRVALVTSASALLNVFAKWTLRQPRPYFMTDGIEPLEASDGFGMPSGHAQGSATAWGAVARFGRSRAIAWLGAAMTFLAGLARIYFGVHSTLQVVCGWAVGIAIVIVAARLEPRIVGWWSTAAPAARWAAVFAPPLALLGAGFLLRALLQSQWTVPEAWVERHLAAAELHREGAEDLRLFDVSSLARWTGALLGASLAAAWWAAPGRAALVMGTWSRRFIPTAMGATGGFAELWLGGRAIAVVGEMAELARFAVLLWVIGVAAPWLAERLWHRLEPVVGEPKS